MHNLLYATVFIQDFFMGCNVGGKGHIGTKPLSYNIHAEKFSKNFQRMAPVFLESYWKEILKI